MNQKQQKKKGKRGKTNSPSTTSRSSPSHIHWISLFSFPIANRTTKPSLSLSSRLTTGTKAHRTTTTTKLQLSHISQNHTLSLSLTHRHSLSLEPSLTFSLSLIINNHDHPNKTNNPETTTTNRLSLSEPSLLSEPFLSLSHRNYHRNHHQPPIYPFVLFALSHWISQRSLLLRFSLPPSPFLSPSFSVSLTSLRTLSLTLKIRNGVSGEVGLGF